VDTDRVTRLAATNDPEYPPIAAHGVIGDLRTAALVTTSGKIDFLCAPEFDSPTVFARLIDAERGGSFSIELEVDVSIREQRYLRDTNVLLTRLAGTDAEVEIIDFMPVERGPSPSRIVRYVRMLRGTSRLRCLCAPRFDYARGTHLVAVRRGSADFMPLVGPALRLTTRVPLRFAGHDIAADVELEAGNRVAFVLELDATARSLAGNVDRWARRALRKTVVFWRRWIAKSTYLGEWRDAVRRSALTLKLLQSRRTGAIVAAPTFGLPETIGGARNWDFRYAWIRDSAFVAYALGRVGLRNEARAFTRWLIERCEQAVSPGELRTLYTIDGTEPIAETLLEHLHGYRGSRPIRIGNAAQEQLQLDIYGELMDALYQQDEHAERMTRALWSRVVQLTDWISHNWHRADQGIWEVRSGAQEFLYSRVLCWVAVDRALRIASRRRLPAPRAEWEQVRHAIRADVEREFWNGSLGAFVGTRRGDTVDAACLVMPLVGFIAPSDPRWQSTLRLVEQRLVRDGRVRRYDMLGMDTDAGGASAPSFTFCSFWYVECLARGGEISKARDVMRGLMACANHLGLFSEDLGVNGELLGNYPQGLVGAALIGAAVALGMAPHSHRTKGLSAMPSGNSM
jgi:GH15 family glucan-1,4-alpha-glucosidase